MIKNICFLILIITGISVQAQNTDFREQLSTTGSTDQDSISRIELKAEFRDGKMWLRWGLTNPYDWAMSTLQGVILERYELKDDGLPIIDSKLVKTIKPWSRSKFDSYERDSTTNFLVMREALYAMNYAKMSKDNVFGTAAEDIMDYHGFAHLSAEFDFDISVAGGLGYLDDGVTAGKDYFYKISPVAQTIEINKGLLTIKAEEEPIPPPFIKNAFEKEQQVMIQWEREYHELHFSGYWIERKESNGKYRRLNEQPFVGGYTDDYEGNYFSYTDSVKNYAVHDYRIVGITPFSRLSAPSVSVRLQGRDNTPCIPISDVTIDTDPNKKSVTLDWGDIICQDLNGYQVERANSLDGVYQSLTRTPIKKSTYVDQIESIHQKHYYRVSSIDTAGNAMASMSFLAVFRDTLPPAAPTALTGTVDTTGVVSLSWRSNREEDLAGYHVYRSNDKSHAFALLNAKHVDQSSYVDTISMKTLTETVYYRITAVDIYGHVSEFSEIIELSRPDLIPPFPPTITDYVQTDDGILLKWNPSQTKDVQQQILYRKTGTTAWKEIQQFETKKAEFLDTDIEINGEYSYQLLAIDDAGLKSNEHSTISLKVVDLSTPNDPENLTCRMTDKGHIEINMDITYTDKSKGVIVYRSVGAGPLTVLKRLGKEQIFVDTTNRKGVDYQYAVKHIWQNNKKSKFSAKCTPVTQ